MANTDAYAEESVLSLEDNGEAGVGACLGNIAPHAPDGESTFTHGSLAGAWGIPECMPPNRRRTFIIKRVIYGFSAI